MARAYWSGQVNISLVSFAVEIYPATSPAGRVQFRQIDRVSGNRIHYQNVAAPRAPSEEPTALEELTESEEEETTSAPPMRDHSRAGGTHPSSTPPPVESEERHQVAKSDVVKGYEYEKGKYAIVEPEELKRLRLSGKKTLDVAQFSPSAEIPPALYEKPYFVVPKKGQGAQAFAIVRQAMVATGMVALGKIVFAGREHLAALAPPPDAEQPGMMLYTLRFASELRDPTEYFSRIEAGKADAAQFAMAKQLIQAYSHPFELDKFNDSYEAAVRELVEAKVTQQPLPTDRPERVGGKVMDLMDALRRSLEAKSAAHEPKAKRPARAEPIAAKSSMMLVPAKGKKRA